MPIAMFPIEEVEVILMHSMDERRFTPSFSQLFEGRFRKDGKDVDMNDLPLDQWPKADEVDTSKIPPQFFLVKDSGAYIMAGTETPLLATDGRNKHFVSYCEGCHPEKDDDYYQTSREMFGGDDFSEPLPLGWLIKAVKVAKQCKLDYMFLDISEDSIEIIYPTGAGSLK